MKLDETAYKATRARLSLLLRDAEARKEQRVAAGDKDNAIWYSGLTFAYKRALDVLDGKG